jgi:hypothetical protein
MGRPGQADDLEHQFLIASGVIELKIVKDNNL